MSVELIPHCYDCRVKLIWTQFENGVFRYLCPVCKKKIYGRMHEGSCVKDEFYSIKDS